MRFTLSLLVVLATFLVVSPAMSNEQNSSKLPSEQSYTVHCRWIKESNKISTFPVMTLSDGKAASMSNITQSPFVTGVTQITGTIAIAQHPHIVTIDEGLEINLTVAGRQPNGASVNITVEKTKITSVGTRQINPNTTIQIPSVDIQKKQVFEFVKFGHPFIVSLGKKSDFKKTGHIEIVLNAIKPTTRDTLTRAEKDRRSTTVLERFPAKRPTVHR